ncbi:LysM peptidoglycan-binding domain-containing protein [Anaerolinea sp.]|uniref:LysM peptidoglycan-binding domain-containing protein n=1 Tax=Anaerolinea sp. TaxID=1872519 RepID=UPI002ACDC467|nr:LysM peptidoglycan-binding domain-containing protein [Anaerolinea sp.]
MSGLLFLLSSVQAQAGTPEELIAAVNALRAQRGLPALTVSTALMAASQSHAEYQASIKSITHTGAGNTRPKDRAIAAGYGGGAAVFVSENIAGGTNLSVQDAITLYWSDDVYMNTMLNPNFQHVGAGVAFSGDMVYYTLVVGSTSGSSNALPVPNTPTLTSTPAPALAQATITPPAAATSTPDESQMYEVQPGDTLWGIALTYQVSMEDIKRWNNLPATPNLWPGDRLIVQPSFTPAPSATGTPLPTVTPTLAFTATPMPTIIVPVTAITMTSTPETTSPSSRFSPLPFIGIGLIVLSVLGMILLFVGKLQGK